MTSPFYDDDALNKMYEASKDDKSQPLVGSEVRCLISDIRHARAAAAEAQPVGYLAPILTREEWIILLPIIAAGAQEAADYVGYAMEIKAETETEKILKQSLIDTRVRRMAAIQAIYDKIYPTTFRS